MHPLYLIIMYRKFLFLSHSPTPTNQPPNQTETERDRQTHRQRYRTCKTNFTVLIKHIDKNWCGVTHLKKKSHTNHQKKKEFTLVNHPPKTKQTKTETDRPVVQDTCGKRKKLIFTLNNPPPPTPTPPPFPPISHSITPQNAKVSKGTAKTKFKVA